MVDRPCENCRRNGRFADNHYDFECGFCDGTTRRGNRRRYNRELESQQVDEAEAPRRIEAPRPQLQIEEPAQRQGGDQITERSTTGAPHTQATEPAPLPPIEDEMARDLWERVERRGREDHFGEFLGAAREIRQEWLDNDLARRLGGESMPWDSRPVDILDDLIEALRATASQW